MLRRTDKSESRLVVHSVDFLFSNYSHFEGSMECTGNFNDLQVFSFVVVLLFCRFVFFFCF